MQVQGADSVLPSSSRYGGPLECALKTVKCEGVRNFLIYTNLPFGVHLS